MSLLFSAWLTKKAQLFIYCVPDYCLLLQLLLIIVVMFATRTPATLTMASAMVPWMLASRATSLTGSRAVHPQCNMSPSQ